MTDLKARKKKGDDPPQKNPWKDRIKRMRKYQGEHSKYWKRNEKLLFGATESGEKENPIAYGWSMVKSLETSIYVQNPDMMVEAYDDSRRELGSILTQIANFDIDQMDLKTVGNLGLIDVFTCGFCAVIELVETPKRTVRYPKTEKEAKEGKGEEVEDPEAQRYVVKRIAPKDLLVPRGTRLLDLSDAPYVAVAFYPTIQELKDDKKFDLPSDIEERAPNADTLSSEPKETGAKTGEAKGTGEEKDPEYKRVLCWEIHDKVNQQLIYMLDYNGEIVSEIDWPAKFQIGGRSLYSISVMAMNQLPNEWYSKPEIELIAPQLIMLNRIETMIMKDAADKWRKYACWGDVVPEAMQGKITDTTSDTVQLIVLDPSQIDKLSGSQNHEVPDVDRVVGEIKDPAPKRDLLPIREMLKGEIGDVLGYGPPASGGMPKTRSAREAVAVKERQEQRLSKRADAVGDFYRQFGQKHLLLLQQTMVLPRYVRLFEKAKDLASWRQYDIKDIQGDFNFIVHSGTSRPRTTEAYRNSEMQLFQTLMPLVQTGQIPYEPVVLRLAESQQWKGMNALLRNYKPAVEQLAMVLAAMKMQKGVPPNALPESAAAVVQAVLTPEQIAMVAKRIQGGGQGQGGGPPASNEGGGQRGDSNPMGTETATM